MTHIEIPASAPTTSLEATHQLARESIVQQTHLDLESLSKLIAPVATIAIAIFGFRTMLKGVFH